MTLLTAGEWNIFLKDLTQKNSQKLVLKEKKKQATFPEAVYHNTLGIKIQISGYAISEQKMICPVSLLFNKMACNFCWKTISQTSWSQKTTTQSYGAIFLENFWIVSACLCWIFTDVFLLFLPKGISNTRFWINYSSQIWEAKWHFLILFLFSYTLSFLLPTSPKTRLTEKILNLICQ